MNQFTLRHRLKIKKSYLRTVHNSAVKLSDKILHPDGIPANESDCTLQPSVGVVQNPQKLINSYLKTLYSSPNSHLLWLFLLLVLFGKALFVALVKVTNGNGCMLEFGRSLINKGDSRNYRYSLFCTPRLCKIISGASGVQVCTTMLSLDWQDC